MHYGLCENDELRTSLMPTLVFSILSIVGMVSPAQEIDIIREFKGTGSRFSACSFIKMLFFCRDILYRLCKQYDHVIMLSKSQSAHSLGSHLHLINLNIFK